MTVVTISPNDALLSVASNCIGRFLQSKSANLQYIGNISMVCFSVHLTIYKKKLTNHIWKKWILPSNLLYQNWKNKIISAAVETEVFITGSVWSLKSVQVVYFAV